MWKTPVPDPPCASSPPWPRTGSTWPPAALRLLWGACTCAGTAGRCDCCTRLRCSSVRADLRGSNTSDLMRGEASRGYGCYGKARGNRRHRPTKLGGPKRGARCAATPRPILGTFSQATLRPRRHCRLWASPRGNRGGPAQRSHARAPVRWPLPPAGCGGTICFSTVRGEGFFFNSESWFYIISLEGLGS